MYNGGVWTANFQTIVHFLSEQEISCREKNKIKLFTTAVRTDSSREEGQLYNFSWMIEVLGTQLEQYVFHWNGFSRFLISFIYFFNIGKIKTSLSTVNL
jgi:hypothetical protein